MRESQEGITALRRSGFEKCEDRLAMAGDVLGAVATSISADALATTAAFTPGSSSQVSYVRDTYGLTGKGQTVAVIDTGIAWDHVALGGGLGAGYRVVGGWDFTEENDANPYDDGPAGLHGTHVAGIIGANAAGRMGVAPGVDLVALRVANDMGNSSFNWIENALRWVHAHRNDFANPITTVNISMGVASSSYTAMAMAQIDDELSMLQRDGIFVVAAAGNDFSSMNRTGLSYPASSAYVTAAASSAADGRLSGFSQRVTNVLAAPGEALISTVPDYAGNFNSRCDDYMALSGTSMASPYLAGAGVLVREAMQRVGYTDLSPAAISRHLFTTADQKVDSATGVAYRCVNLVNAIDTLMAQASSGGSNSTGTGSNTGTGSGGASGSGGQTTSPTVASPVNWGKIDFDRVTGAQVEMGRRFEFCAGNSGTLTIVAETNREFTFELFDRLGRSLGTRVVPAGGTRVDFEVKAGDTFQMCITKGGASANFTLVNLVQVAGTQVTVAGSDTNDVIEIGTAGGRYVSVNGIRYNLAANTGRIALAANQGSDQLTVIGDSSAEIVNIRQGRLDWQRNGLAVTADGFEKVKVISGGGNDIVNFFDSAGDDVFTASPTTATLAGSGFEFVASGFRQVVATASTGNDTARLSDSVGNDLFKAWHNRSQLSGGSYTIGVNLFDRVDATASNGVDRAVMYDSLGNDVFSGNSTTAEMRGATFQNRATKFDFVSAYSTGGADTANVLGTAGNEDYARRGSTQSLAGASFSITVVGFRATAFSGGGGYDRATLYDLGVGDLVSGVGNRALLSHLSGTAAMSDFDFISARAKTSQTARAQMQPVDFVFEKLGRWA